MMVYGYRRVGDATDDSTAGGAAVASAEESGGESARHAIYVGVATGVLVWTITRLLDRIFGLSSRAQ